MSHRVRFPGRGHSVRVSSGTVLLDAVREAGLPIARACGGEGLCGRCGVEVVEGVLGDEAPAEARAKQRNRVDASLRLACRARVESDLSVDASYW